MRNSTWNFFDLAVALLGCLVALFLPLPYAFISFQSSITDFFFGPMVTLISSFLGYEMEANTYYSDSVSSFALYLILIVLTTVLVSMASRIKSDQLLQVLRSFSIYFIAYQLLRYGFDKVFLGQFYAPTSYVLQTEFGQLDRDLLYWSVMGLSPTYSIILGSIELACATLLLIPKTQIIGLVLSTSIFFQILAVNIGFDISVKMFSLFLLILSLGLLRPWFASLWQFFILNKESKIGVSQPSSHLILNPKLRVSIRVVVVVLIAFDAVHPSIERMFHSASSQTIHESIPALDQDVHWFIESVK